MGGISKRTTILVLNFSIACRQRWKSEIGYGYGPGESSPMEQEQEQEQEQPAEGEKNAKAQSQHATKTPIGLIEDIRPQYIFKQRC